MSRYSRHLDLPGFSPEHLSSIRTADVLVVGAGGLGAATIAYLAGAGVGRLRIVDDDVVEDTNLCRQLLFCVQDVGRSKADVAGERVRVINPDVEVVALPMRLTQASVAEMLKGVSVVVDCSDNLSTKYLLGRAANRHRIPCVWGALGQYAGSCSVVMPGGPCFECAFGPEEQVPEWPAAGEQGIFAPICGVIGSLAAGEVLKVITGLGSTLAGYIAVLDLLTTDLTRIPLFCDPQCQCCAAGETVLKQY